MKKIIIVFSLVGVCILWTFTWGEVEKEALVKAKV